MKKYVQKCIEKKNFLANFKMSINIAQKSFILYGKCYYKHQAH